MKRMAFLGGILVPLLGLYGLGQGPALAEDIDIYVQGGGDTSGNPNVLIILDNTSNWNSNAQHWPGGISQGQAEIHALAMVLHSLPDDKVNVGLMMNTNAVGGAGMGAYMRFAIRCQVP